MTNEEVLALPMQPNDAEAATVKDYLKTLLLELWNREESFSGKRPFGNSGWQSDVNSALVVGGAVAGTIGEDGYGEPTGPNAARAVVLAAIAAL
jgi:hypothetical protein